MCKVNIYEAKTNLSKYVEMLENGTEEEIIITRYDKKVAVLKLFGNCLSSKIAYKNVQVSSNSSILITE